MDRQTITFSPGIIAGDGSIVPYEPVELAAVGAVRIPKIKYRLKTTIKNDVAHAALYINCPAIGGRLKFRASVPIQSIRKLFVQDLDGQLGNVISGDDELYDELGNIFGDLWRGIKRVGKEIYKGAAKVINTISKGAQKIAKAIANSEVFRKVVNTLNHPAIQFAAMAIPGLGPGLVAAGQVMDKVRTVAKTIAAAEKGDLSAKGLLNRAMKIASGTGPGAEGIKKLLSAAGKISVGPQVRRQIKAAVNEIKRYKQRSAATRKRTKLRKASASSARERILARRREAEERKESAAQRYRESKAATAPAPVRRTRTARPPSSRPKVAPPQNTRWVRAWVAVPA